MRTINLNGDRKLSNLCKKNGLKLINPKGEFNGYGYTKLPLHVILENEVEQNLFNEIKKSLVVVIKETKTFDEIKSIWAKRLSKLTNESLEDCLTIADEKLEYKESQIEKVEDKQAENYSSKREKLINKMKKENPLRRITDEAHAQAIISASNRHNSSDYESKLNQARELAKDGLIDKSEVKEYARQNIRYYNV